MNETKERRVVFALCVYLAGITWVVFGQTLHYQFVNFDDSAYVYENWPVTKGLSLQGIFWAFKHPVLYLWSPLTTISHMLDCQLFGLARAGHHLTNVLLHIAVVILLFLSLRRMTGALWPSAFVAAVFAIHPLRVESVAWIAERKDVLSGLFFMLALWAYVHYIRSRSLGFYLAVALFFALGLMAKPMLVTLPFVLLLLDYWPLGRARGESGKGKLAFGRLILEKVPLFALSAASCVMTFLVEEKIPGIQVSHFAIPLRIGNALVSPITYLAQMFYPAGLAVMYPFPPAGQPLWEVILASILLVSISGWFFLRREKQPYLLVGWLWYLGMLTPVIGVLQMGREAHADRYTYLPQIGIYILLTWLVLEMSAGWRYRSRVLGGLAAIILAALMLCARVQASYWKDSESMWRRMLACSPDQPMALPHVDLGLALVKKGEIDDGIAEFRKALEIKPNDGDANVNLGNAFLQLGREDEAVPFYYKSLRAQPWDLTTQNNLAWVLATSANPSIRNGVKAVELARTANALSHGDNPMVLRTLAAAYAETGHFDIALVAARQALKALPPTDIKLSDALRAEIALYQAGIRYRHDTER